MSKAKLLQFVSGVNVLTFWLASFIWDYLTYMVTTVLLIVTMAVFQEEGWSSPAELARTGLVLTLFGFGMLPLMYIGSMLFTVPSTGYVRMILFNIITGKDLFVLSPEKKIVNRKYSILRVYETTNKKFF